MTVNRLTYTPKRAECAKAIAEHGCSRCGANPGERCWFYSRNRGRREYRELAHLHRLIAMWQTEFAAREEHESNARAHGWAEGWGQGLSIGWDNGVADAKAAMDSVAVENGARNKKPDSLDPEPDYVTNDRMTQTIRDHFTI